MLAEMKKRCEAGGRLLLPGTGLFVRSVIVLPVPEQCFCVGAILQALPTRRYPGKIVTLAEGSFERC